jgi:hypothetical protein
MMGLKGAYGQLMIESSKVMYVIDLYNKFRSPEAVASLVKVDEETIQISFKGSFCFTCGLNEWFEDFRLLLEENGINSKIYSIEQIDVDEFLVTFRINDA